MLAISGSLGLVAMAVGYGAGRREGDPQTRGYQCVSSPEGGGI